MACTDPIAFALNELPRPPPPERELTTVFDLWPSHTHN